MRKDLVFGMSIGGIVLAIAVIYFTLSSHKPKQLVTLDTGSGTGDVSAPGTGPDDASTQPDRSTDTTAPIGGHAPAPLRAEAGGSVDAAPPLVNTGAPADRSDSGWYKKLYGSNEPMVGTQTPSELGASGSAKFIVTTERSHPGQISPGSLSTGGSYGVNDRQAAAVGNGRMRQHRVQTGESFSSISAAAYGKASLYKRIMTANPGVDPRKLKPGMLINIPEDGETQAASDSAEPTVLANVVNPTAIRPRNPLSHLLTSGKEYEVQSGDNLYRIASKVYGTISMVQPLYEANKDVIGPNPAKLKLGAILRLPSAAARG